MRDKDVFAQQSFLPIARELRSSMFISLAIM